MADLRFIFLRASAWLNCSAFLFSSSAVKWRHKPCFCALLVYNLTCSEGRGRGPLMLWARTLTILALWLLWPCQLKASTDLHQSAYITPSPPLVHFSSINGICVCMCVCVVWVQEYIHWETAGLSNLSYLSAAKCPLKWLADGSLQWLLWLLEHSRSEYCWIFHTETKTLSVPTSFCWNVEFTSSTVSWRSAGELVIQIPLFSKVPSWQWHYLFWGS